MMLWLILFFAPAAFGATEWWSRAILESLIFILAAMCAMRPDFAAPLNTPLIGFGAILLIGCLQLIQARLVNTPTPFLPFTLSRPQTSYALILWAALAALLWASSGIFRWEGSTRRALLAIFFTGLFIGVVGIIQRGHGNLYYYGIRPVMRGLAFGPFVNYNHAAAWMVISACVGGGGLFAIFQHGGKSPLSERLAQGVLVAFCQAILIAAIVSTGSRGALASLLVSSFSAVCLSAVALTSKMSRRMAVGAGVIWSAACVGLFLTSPRWLGLVGGEFDQSVVYRLSMYRSGWAMLLDFPITGVGLGAFANAAHSYRETIIPGLVDHVHSSWLEIGLESGVFGLAVFLGTVVLGPLIRLARQIVFFGKRGRAMAVGCFTAVLAFVIHGMVEFSFQIPALAALFVVLLGASSALLGGEDDAVVVSRGVPRPLLTGTFAVFALLSLPPGLSDLRPRLSAPFGSATDTILPSSAVRGGLNGVHQRLLLNPTEPGLRQLYGAALWQAGRRRDAELYLNDPGKVK